MNNITFNFFEHLDMNNEKVSEENILEFEKKYSFSLPEDYKKLLLIYNGGYFSSSVKIDEKYYDSINSYSEKTHINEFYSLQEIIEIFENDSIDEEDKFYSEKIIPNKLVPIAVDYSSIFRFYIGAGDNNQGKVYSYDHQLEYSKKGDELKCLCNSFTDFISGFMITVEDIA